MYICIYVYIYCDVYCDTNFIGGKRIMDDLMQLKSISL